MPGHSTKAPKRYLMRIIFNDQPLPLSFEKYLINGRPLSLNFWDMFNEGNAQWPLSSSFQCISNKNIFEYTPWPLSSRFLNIFNEESAQWPLSWTFQWIFNKRILEHIQWPLILSFWDMLNRESDQRPLSLSRPTYLIRCTFNAHFLKASGTCLMRNTFNGHSP